MKRAMLALGVLLGLASQIWAGGPEDIEDRHDDLQRKDALHRDLGERELYSVQSREDRSEPERHLSPQIGTGRQDSLGGRRSSREDDHGSELLRRSERELHENHSESHRHDGLHRHDRHHSVDDDGLDDDDDDLFDDDDDAFEDDDAMEDNDDDSLDERTHNRGVEDSAHRHEEMHRISAHRHELRHALAGIERFRDRAIERGDLNALDHADKMEHEVLHEMAKLDLPTDEDSSPDDDMDNSLDDNGLDDDMDDQLDDNDGPEIVYGPGYGRATAQEARKYGREFGQHRAQQVRDPEYRDSRSTGNQVPPTDLTGPGYGRATAQEAGGREKPESWYSKLSLPFFKGRESKSESRIR